MIRKVKKENNLFLCPNRKQYETISILLFNSTDNGK